MMLLVPLFHRTRLSLVNDSIRCPKGYQQETKEKRMKDGGMNGPHSLEGLTSSKEHAGVLYLGSQER